MIQKELKWQPKLQVRMICNCVYCCCVLMCVFVVCIVQLAVGLALFGGALFYFLRDYIAIIYTSDKAVIAKTGVYKSLCVVVVVLCHVCFRSIECRRVRHPLIACVYVCSYVCAVGCARFCDIINVLCVARHSRRSVLLHSLIIFTTFVNRQLLIGLCRSRSTSFCNVDRNYW